MSMLFYAVDLGTTNIKVVLFDDEARQLAIAREPVAYRRQADRVEFDPEAVLDTVLRLIRTCATDAHADETAPAHIVVTGQAESLVLCDADGHPVAAGISWMDERSRVEAAEIAEHFGAESAFAVTGEPEPVPTWPATKLRWLTTHRPEVLAGARHVLMIKDFVLLRLTGVAVGEETTRGFTYLYDVPRRRYWDEMAEFCGTSIETLPEVVPAGTPIGPVLADVADALPRSASYTVNTGALDHFCAMVGTSSYRAGVLSASAGTVLALSLLTADWTFDPASAVSFHPGLRPGETILFTCADSGGVVLDWFLGEVATGLPYDALERELSERDHSDAPLFLPYLTGVNPPDFDPAARGAFVDLQLRHDRVSMAYAVVEGLAHLLRRNIDDLRAHGQGAHSLITAGGGTASRFWNQLKADVCGLDVRVPNQQEVACRGATILALAAAGAIDSVDDTAHLQTPPEHTYRPRPDAALRQRYDRFNDTLHRLYGS